MDRRSHDLSFTFVYIDDHGQLRQARTSRAFSPRFSKPSGVPDFYHHPKVHPGCSIFLGHYPDGGDILMLGRRGDDLCDYRELQSFRSLHRFLGIVTEYFLFVSGCSELQKKIAQVPHDSGN